MKKISLELLKQCANNLMFDMKEDEYKTLLNEFDDLVKQIQMIDKIKDVDTLEPMTFPFMCATSFLREDEAGEMLTPEEALRNAKDVTLNQIRLPKVVK